MSIDLVVSFLQVNIQQLNGVLHMLSFLPQSSYLSFCLKNIMFLEQSLGGCRIIPDGVTATEECISFVCYPQVDLHRMGTSHSRTW